MLTKGIIISGTISYFFSLFTSIAALIMASACILIISGWTIASLQPLKPSIGLTSVSSSTLAARRSYETSNWSASTCISSSDCGINSWSIGSSKRMFTGLSPIVSNILLKSLFWNSSIRSSASLLSFSSSASIILLKTGSLSSLKNMCSVLQSPIPSAPNITACLASAGLSAFVLTFIYLNSSAHSIIFEKSSDITGGVVSIRPLNILPVLPSSDIKSPSSIVSSAMTAQQFSSSTFRSAHPAIQHLPIPRATSAACDVIPPCSVKTPSATAIPARSSGEADFRISTTWYP